jgi:transcriptional regulator with XRE-family HTH domain
MPAKTVVKNTDLQQPDTLAADFGKRLGDARKARNLSQDEVGQRAGLRGAVVGRYERAEARPSVEIAARLAVALNASLDYLTGVSDDDLDPDTARRIIAVQRLKPAQREHVFALLDAFVRDAKTAEAYAA